MTQTNRHNRETTGHGDRIDVQCDLCRTKGKRCMGCAEEYGKVTAEPSAQTSRHVRQTHPKGCVIACLAMVTGLHYDTILLAALELFPDFLPEKRGISSEEMITILDDLEFSWESCFPVKFLHEGLHIATVPSLTTIGQGHCIVIDNTEGFVILDPQEGNPGKLVYADGMLKTYSDVIRVWKEN